MPLASLPSPALGGAAAFSSQGSQSQRTKAWLVGAFWRDGQVKGHILFIALRCWFLLRSRRGHWREQKTRTKEASLCELPSSSERGCGCSATARGTRQRISDLPPDYSLTAALLQMRKLPGTSVTESRPMVCDVLNPEPGTRPSHP